MVLSEEEMSLPIGGASTSSRIRCPAEVLLESDILSQEQILVEVRGSTWMPRILRWR